MSIRTQLEAIAKKRMQDASEIARVSIIRVGNRVITQTPVKNAILINSWRTGINSINKNGLTGGSQVGADSINELVEAVGGLEVGATAYFTNPQPYAKRIEYDGHSSEKAPNGMLRVNTDLWEMIVNQEVEKRK